MLKTKFEEEIIHLTERCLRLCARQYLSSNLLFVALFSWNEMIVISEESKAVGENKFLLSH